MASSQFYGQGFGPSKGTGLEAQRTRIPVLSAGLVVLYILYVLALIILPFFIEPYGKALDGLLSPLIRLIIAGILILVFSGLMVMDLSPRDGPLKPTGVQPPLMNRAPPLTAPQRPIGPNPSRFVPVGQASPPGPERTSEPQTALRAREFERSPAVPTVFSYPQEVEGGIYGDTFIQISSNKILKVRSLIVDKRYLS